jgi:hypothetical protein
MHALNDQSIAIASLFDRPAVCSAALKVWQELFARASDNSPSPSRLVATRQIWGDSSRPDLTPPPDWSPSLPLHRPQHPVARESGQMSRFWAGSVRRRSNARQIFALRESSTSSWAWWSASVTVTPWTLSVRRTRDSGGTRDGILLGLGPGVRLRLAGVRILIVGQGVFQRLPGCVPALVDGVLGALQW